jgi:hypothetical protein
MEKEKNGFATDIGSFRKIFATIPETLFIKLRDSDILKPGRFDNFMVQAILDRLAKEGLKADKTPRKKDAEEGEAE